MVLHHRFDNASNAQLAHVCGELDGHLRTLEQACAVTLRRRHDEVRIEGPAAGARPNEYQLCPQHGFAPCAVKNALVVDGELDFGIKNGAAVFDEGHGRDEQQKAAHQPRGTAAGGVGGQEDE